MTLCGRLTLNPFTQPILTERKRKRERGEQEGCRNRAEDMTAISHPPQSGSSRQRRQTTAKKKKRRKEAGKSLRQEMGGSVDPIDGRAIIFLVHDEWGGKRGGGEEKEKEKTFFARERGKGKTTVLNVKPVRATAGQ